MSQKVLFVVYDNGSYDHTIPMGFGAIGAFLKRDGHEFTLWNQDMHHYPDDYLRTYLDKNKFDQKTCIENQRHFYWMLSIISILLLQGYQ